MKKLYKYLALSPIILGCSSGLTSCSNKQVSEKYTLKIINSEDYIYLDDENPDNDMTEQFKRYAKANGYPNVDVVYDTSDTNETLYSELQTGKSDYDLINVSDYMAQKMITDGLVVPLFKEGESRADLIPNYESYASATLKRRLDNIEAPIKVRNSETGKMETQYVKLKDYAVGYMWGTLGILFNPEYSAYSNYGKDEVLNDFHYSYSALWNKKYQGSISIKNSMRDTFAAGLMAAYEGDFITLKAALEEALEEAGEDEEKIQEAIDIYMEEYAKVFNGENEARFETVVNKVANKLNSLKNNIFGLEVDSGKQDIVTGKIGINLAWSGDAVYAMDQAEDGHLVGDNQSELYYCVPELGSNLWFDTWVMPKNSNRSEERRELALMFLDFISKPEKAMMNMDYTGYTSFIGGDSVLELIRDWYDMRTDEMYQEVETGKYDSEYYQIYAVAPGDGDDFKAIDYDDCMTFDSTKGEEGRGHLSALNDYLLYYYVPEDEEEPESKADIIAQGNIVYIEDSEEKKTYGDILIVDSEENYGDLAVDLSYFFNDTFDDDSDYINDYDTIFYSDSYYAYPFEEDPEHPGEFYHEVDGEIVYHENNSVGRQFFTQYPDKETIERCAVMKDFGENNKLVMKMWEEFKSDPLPTPAIIIFVIIIASGIGLVGFIVVGKLLTNNIRKKRKKAQK